MRNFYAFLCIGIAGIIGSSSCNLINPDEVVPTYVHIDSFSFSGNPVVTGSNSHRITSVYVYFNNSPVGVFDLPVTFPVMATAPGTLTVLPATDFSGLSGFQAIYPFYLGDTLNLAPAPGETINYAPATEYLKSTVIRLNEEFEQGQGSDNAFMKLTGDTTIVNTIASSEVFEGGGSGLIRLTSGRDSATVITRKGRFIPIGKQAYIELNYRSNMPFWVGMNVDRTDGFSATEYLIGLKPREEWGKIYIGLSDFMGNNQGPEYRILLHAERPQEVSDGFLYLDNLKVVSF
jgi:hypothetical protein